MAADYLKEFTINHKPEELAFYSYLPVIDDDDVE